MGLEPMTYALRVRCSTTELSRREHRDYTAPFDYRSRRRPYALPCESAHRNPDLRRRLRILRASSHVAAATVDVHGRDHGGGSRTHCGRRRRSGSRVRPPSRCPVVVRRHRRPAGSPRGCQRTSTGRWPFLARNRKTIERASVRGTRSWHLRLRRCSPASAARRNVELCGGELPRRLVALHPHHGVALAHEVQIHVAETSPTTDSRSVTHPDTMP